MVEIKNNHSNVLIVVRAEEGTVKFAQQELFFFFSLSQDSIIVC